MLLSVELGHFTDVADEGTRHLSVSGGFIRQLLHMGESEPAALVRGRTQLPCNVKVTAAVALLVIIFDVRMTPVQIQKENQNFAFL